jgi:hypothetical protein
MTCRIALNVGSIICSCVLTQKGTTLKAIVVNLLNLSNRNSYRHSLVFFVSDLVCSASQTVLCGTQGLWKLFPVHLYKPQITNVNFMELLNTLHVAKRNNVL